MSIDALHLCMTDQLQGSLRALDTSKHDEFTISHGDDGDHRVQLPVDSGGIVHDLVQLSGSEDSHVNTPRN